MKILHNKGFTLIELLVVIAIIGVLSSVVLSSMNGARAKSRDAKRKTEMVSIQTALELYRLDNNVYPIVSSWSGYHATACGIVGTLSGPTGYIPNLAPTYITVLPADPSSPFGGCNGYLYYSDGKNYKLLDHANGPESFPAIGTKFYDPVRPTWAWALCNDKVSTFCTSN